MPVISAVESVLEACKKTKWSKRLTMQVEQIESLLKLIAVSQNRRIFEDVAGTL